MIKKVRKFPNGRFLCREEEGRKVEGERLQLCIALNKFLLEGAQAEDPMKE